MLGFNLGKWGENYCGLLEDRVFWSILEGVVIGVGRKEWFINGEKFSLF